MRSDVARERSNSDRGNPAYLPGVSLAPTLRATDDLVAATHDAPVICSVVPSHGWSPARSAAAPSPARGAPAQDSSQRQQGIETDTLQLMGEVAAEVLPQATFVALSGPSFAEEVHAGCPTAIVAASRDASAAAEAQQLFSMRTFRLYSSDDVPGVTLGGSLKNTIAIAAGILDGLGAGNNARAALLTRPGSPRSARLGRHALGAKSATFSGLAGMGDLILTCTGALSRNRQLGMALAGGSTLAEYYASHNTVVEGVNTALAASRLADRHGVDMPITRQVAAVLFDNASPRDSIHSLMERTLKAEF